MLVTPGTLANLSVPISALATDLPPPSPEALRPGRGSQPKIEPGKARTGAAAFPAGPAHLTALPGSARPAARPHPAALPPHSPGRPLPQPLLHPAATGGHSLGGGCQAGPGLAGPAAAVPEGAPPPHQAPWRHCIPPAAGRTLV